MQTISVNGTQLAIFEQGAGPIVLFIHGFPFDHTMYDQAAEALSDSFRCLLPDLRGFGKSEYSATSVDLETGTPLISMADFAADLASLLAGLQITEKIALCGLSMGGYIALEFAKRFPDQLSHLILADTKATPDAPEARQKRLDLAASMGKTDLSGVADAMVPILLSQRSRRERPEIGNFVRAMIMGQSPRAIAAASRGMAVRSDMTEVLRQTRVPVLCLCGEEDKPSPPDVVKAMSEIPECSRFEVLPDCGHMVPLEEPGAFAELLRNFLHETTSHS
ncbi:MAG: alpha/beta hydrolase [Planctomycetia bacterium]|nr:alpha/beta hydrolase [Planctomycetia bacterium]